MESTNPSLYPLLDRAKQEIRLLSFTSSTGIELELTTYSLADGPTYDALSYAWGPQNERTDQEITLNNRRVKVRANLYTALQALCKHQVSNTHPPLRLPKYAQSENLWIDALCIDQGNLLERNHQVQMMRGIYSSAATVRVWLGNECSTTLGLLEEPPTDVESILQVSAKAHATMNPNEGHWLKPFWDAAYWKRLWAVQEFELAKTITFMAGDVCIELDHVKSKLMSLRQARRYEDDERFYYEGSYDVSIRMTQRGRLRRLSFETLILYFPSLQCADPRDLVYGLLGLAWQDSTAEARIEVDYTIDVWALLKRLRRIGIPLCNIPPALLDAGEEKRSKDGELILDTWMTEDDDCTFF